MRAAGYRLAADAARAYDQEMRRMNLGREPNFKTEQEYQAARAEEIRRAEVASALAARDLEKGTSLTYDDEGEGKDKEGVDGREGGAAGEEAPGSPVIVGDDVGRSSVAGVSAVAAVVSPSPAKRKNEEERDSMMAASIVRQLDTHSSLF